MRAVVYHGVGDIRIETVPEPRLPLMITELLSRPPSTMR
jgi:hypothetical protein